MFQCSQSSRGWWNCDGIAAGGVTHNGFSALSRAVVGGTRNDAVANYILAVSFSALSRAVVGGTAGQRTQGFHRGPFQCSQSSRGWWNIRFDITSAAARAVSVLSVEPWLVEHYIDVNAGSGCKFQCSQSSRGWWNPILLPARRSGTDVSVLSVEPWLVERPNAAHMPAPENVSVLSVEPWLVERFRAARRR